MGCPDIYYKKALQTLCYVLNRRFNAPDRAELMYHTKDVSTLENEVRRLKYMADMLDKDDFIYEAGRVSMYVELEANKNDGCDGYNACLGGLYAFEEFVLEREDKE